MTLPATWMLAALAAVNFIAFAAQGLDKRRAERKQWRIPERTLLLLGLPLGAPGMLCGMAFFRHKTRKTSFLLVAALVVMANLVLAAGLAWLMHARHIRFVWGN